MIIRLRICKTELPIWKVELKTKSYSSKDSIIMENLPTKDGIDSISEQVCFFFDQLLGYKTSPGRFKTCHYLGTRNKTKPTPVIEKFIYFEEKNEIYGRKSWLAKHVNPNNGRKIYLRERLPRHQKQILDHALEQNLTTRTKNCNGKYFCKNQAGKFNSVVVNMKKAVDDTKIEAVEKKPRNSNVFTASVKRTPDRRKQFTDGDVRAFLKRIRQSTDEDGLQVLESICLDSKTDKNTISTEKSNKIRLGDDYMELSHKPSSQN